MKKILMSLMVLVLAAVCFAENYPVRTWTFNNGKTLEGSFVKVRISKTGKECVMIDNVSGSESGPMLKNLSEADQAYVKSLKKTDAK